jgi:hypothetical protein
LRHSTTMEESQLIITAVRLSAEGGVDRVFVAKG